MPDTPANQAVWPQPMGQKPGCGFPVMRMAGLFSLAGGALLEHTTAHHHTHDSTLFRWLWPKLKKDDVILAWHQDDLYRTGQSVAKRLDRELPCPVA